MENNTDMKQYLDPKFIYTASIRLHTNGKTEFRKAYAVSKEALRRYAKWVDADRFVLTETFELSDGVLSEEALQLDSCESVTKQELRDYLGETCKFMPNEEDDQRYKETVVAKSEEE